MSCASLEASLNWRIQNSVFEVFLILVLWNSFSTFSRYLKYMYVAEFVCPPLYQVVSVPSVVVTCGV